MNVPRPSKDVIDFVIAHPAWNTSGIVALSHLNARTCVCEVRESRISSPWTEHATVFVVFAVACIISFRQARDRSWISLRSPACQCHQIWRRWWYTIPRSKSWADSTMCKYLQRQSKRYQYTLIFKLCWTYFEAILAHLGPTYPTLEPFLAQLEPILSYWNHLGLSWRLSLTIWTHLEVSWRPSWAVLKAIFGYLNPSWGILEASWDQEFFRYLRTEIAVPCARHFSPFWDPFWGPKFAYF